MEKKLIRNLDELRAERERLYLNYKQKELIIAEQSKDLADGVGKMAADKIIQIIQSRALSQIAPFIQNIKASYIKKNNQDSSEEEESILTMGLSFAKELITPKVIFSLLRPIITTFIINKVRSFFHHNKGKSEKIKNIPNG